MSGNGRCRLVVASPRLERIASDLWGLVSDGWLPQSAVEGPIRLPCLLTKPAHERTVCLGAAFQKAASANDTRASAFSVLPILFFLPSFLCRRGESLTRPKYRLTFLVKFSRAAPVLNSYGRAFEEVDNITCRGTVNKRLARGVASVIRGVQPQGCRLKGAWRSQHLWLFAVVTVPERTGNMEIRHEEFGRKVSGSHRSTKDRLYLALPARSWEDPLSAVTQRRSTFLVLRFAWKVTSNYHGALSFIRFHGERGNVKKNPLCIIDQNKLCQ